VVVRTLHSMQKHSWEEDIDHNSKGKVQASRPSNLSHRAPLFQAAESDFDAVLGADRMHPTQSPKPLASFAEHGPSTLYGHEFLVTVVDEAHQCRTLNKSFFSFFGLMERSRCRVALTATPIISRPQVSDIFTSLLSSILTLCRMCGTWDGFYLLTHSAHLLLTRSITRWTRGFKNQ